MKNTIWETTERIIDALEAYEAFDGEILVCMGEEAFIIENNDTKERYKITITKEAK